MAKIVQSLTRAEREYDQANLQSLIRDLDGVITKLNSSFQEEIDSEEESDSDSDDDSDDNSEHHRTLPSKAVALGYTQPEDTDGAPDPQAEGEGSG